jgi:hypothetical protein
MAGSYTTGTKLYKPEVLEVGWADLVDENFDRLSETAVNVKSYPGVEMDGVNDDSVGFQDAVDDGKNLYLPEGTLTVSNIAAPTNSIAIVGAGPQRTFIQPVVGSTGTLLDLSFASNSSNVALRDLTIDGSTAPTMKLLKTDRTNFLHLNRVQFRYGSIGWEHVQTSGSGSFEVADVNFQNQTTEAIHLTGSSGLGNAGGISDVLIQVTDAAVTMTQGILVDWFTVGVAFDNVSVLGNSTLPGPIGKGIVYNTSAPTGAQGAFLHFSNCVADNIATPGAGLDLTNARGIWSSSGFWSADSTGSGSGISITAGKEMAFSNDWISGKGITFASAPDKVIVGPGCIFPQTIAGGALVMPGSSPPTNLVVSEGVLFYSSITNDPGKLDTATNYRYRWNAGVS